MEPPAGDTIAAIATALGEGGVAIVRVSGTDAVNTVASLTAGLPDLEAVDTHTVHHSWLRDAEGHTLDEAMVTVMRGPRSFTGEDVVEIGVHGGGVVAKRVLRAVFAAGARPAERGEFTKRAFLNGRIDLSQAEAVADVVSAHTEAGADAALAALAGGIARRTESVESELLDLLARLEVNLDFNEDVEAVGREEVGRLLTSARTELDALRERAPWGRRLREGALVVLVGAPNVGKSSLFNALLEDDRALVSSTPGTTRDYLEAWIDIGGIPVRLIDTAGLRDARDGVEAEGVALARKMERDADLCVEVVDLSVTQEAGGGAAVRPEAATRADVSIRVGNKKDLAAENPGAPELRVSARTGEGVAELRARIGEELGGGAESLPAGDVAPSERHEDALRRACESLSLAAASWNDGGTEELIAGDVRDAATALGEITGKTVGEEVLARIFSKFCIGK